MAFGPILVKHHEPGKEEHAGQRSADVERQRREQQAHGAADEAENLQTDAAYAVG
jgi:hypothetical protein